MQRSLPSYVLRKMSSSSNLGYQSIGSFHSENLSDLLRLTPEELDTRIHLLPSRADSIELPTSCTFGHACKHSHFLLDPSWTFLNHGAFGATTRRSFDVATAYRLKMEAQPLACVDRQLFPMFARSIQSLGKILGLGPNSTTDLVLVENATAGLNAVIQSTVLHHHHSSQTSAIVYFDTTYGAVKKTIQTHVQRHGGQAIQESIPFDLMNESTSTSMMVQWLRTRLHMHTVQHGIPIELLVLDHIASNTAFVFPILELVKVAHEFNIPVVVDGAHGLLNQDLSSLEHDIQADFYIGNCHKWLSSAKGCGFLYVHPNARIPKDQIRPSIVSHGYDHDFQNAFIFNGLRDYAAAMSLHDTLFEWTDLIGISKARSYMHRLAYDGGQLLAQRWNTEMMYTKNEKRDSWKNAMALVRLPPLVGATEYTSTDAKNIQDMLHYQHRIEVPVKAIHGQLFVRISAHIYNELSDYQELANAIGASNLFHIK